MLQCKICGYKAEKMLSQHLKYKHSLTSDEYIKMYPGEKIISEEFSRMITKHNQSDEMRRLTAMRNRTTEMREAVARKNKIVKPQFSKEERRVRSIRVSKRNKEMWQNQDYREHMCKSISISQKKVMNRPESIQRQREVMKRNWSNPEIANRMLNAPKTSWGFANRGEYVSKKFNKTFKYKSSGEKDFLEICETCDSITSLDYETLHLKLHSEHIYTPDFIAVQNGNTYLIEIKYDEDPEEYQEKIDYALEYCSNNDMHLCYIRRFIEMSVFRETQDLSQIVFMP